MPIDQQVTIVRSMDTSSRATDRNRAVSPGTPRGQRTRVTVATSHTVRL